VLESHRASRFILLGWSFRDNPLIRLWMGVLIWDLVKSPYTDMTSTIRFLLATLLLSSVAFNTKAESFDALHNTNWGRFVYPSHLYPSSRLFLEASEALDGQIVSSLYPYQHIALNSLTSADASNGVNLITADDGKFLYEPRISPMGQNQTHKIGIQEMEGPPKFLFTIELKIKDTKSAQI